MRELLKRAINQEGTLEFRVFRLFIQTLILISIIVLSYETFPASKKHAQILHQIENLILGVFLVEYILRLIFTEKRLRYLFGVWGLIDFLSIFPVIFSMGVMDFRTLRALRLVRVFRVLKMGRYSKAIATFRVALKEIRYEMLVFLSFSFIVIYVSALGIYHFEHEAQPDKFKNILDALWWAVATLTTVGYGDVFPITTAGRIFTTIILFIGLGVVSVPSALLATALSRARQIQQEQNKETTEA